MCVTIRMLWIRSSAEVKNISVYTSCARVYRAMTLDAEDTESSFTSCRLHKNHCKLEQLGAHLVTLLQEFHAALIIKQPA